MFTVILIVLVIVLWSLLVLMVGLNFTNVKRANAQYANSCFWNEKYKEVDENYSKLEQGRDEESEAYEMQFLSFKETIQGQSTAINSYIEDLHFLVGIVRTHMDDCLPVVDGDLAERERFLAIESQIILEHTGG